VIYLVSNVAAMVTGDCIRVDGAFRRKFAILATFVHLKSS